MPVVFGLMAVTFILAALGTIPIHAESAGERGLRGDPAVAAHRPGGCAEPGGALTAGILPTTAGPRRPTRGADVDARILLVEDDPSIREVTAIGLRQAGFTVETASDGSGGPRPVQRPSPSISSCST